MLVDELENMKWVLEVNTDEMERLREIVEERGFGSASTALKRRAEELEGENEDSCAKFEEEAEVITHREDKKEDLVDEVEAQRCIAVEMQSLLNTVEVAPRSKRRGARGRGGRFKFVEG
ncbi:hypothetical protein PILCRDRAFT_14077 [Piloderma croceum F 1598]|uniref:Uncharacterized protein n=1 Tax=Piloderma croceum (strain F 1598) TaxID=765440 RepID=A0A0C3ALX5_PILCF|nr:hypothetical protein PILCRDRAFT_14077 [Piloderma croceum F 1598]